MSTINVKTLNRDAATFRQRAMWHAKLALKRALQGDLVSADAVWAQCKTLANDARVSQAYANGVRDGRKK